LIPFSKANRLQDTGPYRVVLKQLESVRTLWAAGIDEPIGESALATGPVPLALLQRRDIEAISATVRLADGTRFVVDAHWVWFTESEAEALAARGRTEIPWVFGVAPRLAPR
jgi:hypothetical protein